VFRELFKKEGLLMILSMYPVLERRSGHRKPGGAGERRATCRPPLPAGKRPAHPLPDPSDWSFELIERYHGAIAATAERGWTPTPTSWRSPPSR
jgi:hypothetical protein